MKRFILGLCALGFLMAGTLSAQTNSPYYEGDGGKGQTLVVYAPKGNGFAASDEYILPLVQGLFNTNFTKYSDITVVDRQNLDKILEQQEESASDIYSEDDYISIGHLVNARSLLTGTITKMPTGSYMLEFSVSDVEGGPRLASYGPVQCSPVALENLSAVNAASIDLLGQLEVQLTERGKSELGAEANMRQVRAETALAKGIDAVRKGTVVEALSYFIQSASIDPQLAEAASRMNIVSREISSGNIGQDRRNDAAWRREWLARLAECEQWVTNYVKDTPVPTTLVYSTNPVYGDTNYNTETLPISFDLIALFTDDSYNWAVPIAGVVDVIYEGLQATGRASAWEFGNWPNNSAALGSKTARYDTVVELVNDQGEVIGSTTITLSAGWRTDFREGRTTSDKSDTSSSVRFDSVDLNKVSDILAIRIASLNRTKAEDAARAQSVSIMTKTDYKRMLAQPQLWYDGRRKVPGIGPSGGWVFYDKGFVSDGWRFLEAAPASAEFIATWKDAMAFNGIGGWRLPSLRELALMYQNLKQKGLGDLATDTDKGYWSTVSESGFPPHYDTSRFSTYTNSSIVYWSTSEFGFINDGAYTQNFSDGSQPGYAKKYPSRVRAVREF
jgi:hypothetical protein